MGTCPENTLAGIDAALADGVDAIECDVRATADGVVALMHDAPLERTTGDPRLLAEVAAADIAANVRVRDPFGRLEPQPVPTLAEALDRVGGRATLVIEVKEPGIEAAVAAAVRDGHAAAWCWIWAFDPEVGRACRAVLPEVPVGLNVSPTLPMGLDAWYVDRAVREGFAAVSLDYRLVDAASVEAAHHRGLAVYTWTVDEPADIERVRDAGVDAICGNFPDRISKGIHRAW
jgi:glycerophosphoryl diester phosphodiesterase